MLGLPQTTREMNFYLNGGDYLGGYTPAPASANLGLANPRLTVLSRDTFKSCAVQEDKRVFNWKGFGAMLLCIAASVFAVKSCASKSLELGKDVCTNLGRGVKSVVCSPFNLIGKLFKKNK